jgi:outer membrane protein
MVFLLATPVRALGDAPRPLSLDELVRETLANNTDLRVVETDVASAAGAQMAAAEPFDSALAVVASGTQGYQFSGPDQPPSTALTRTVSAGITWNRRFRNGLSIGPEVNASRTRLYGAGGAGGAPASPNFDVEQTSSRLKVAVPLWRDFGGAVTAAPEQAAGLGRAASEMDARWAQAQVLLQAAGAYWSYLAAERRLEVLAASEERARRDVDETGALVKADERTGADLIQAQGYHSSRRAARIAAEQQRLDAARQLVVLAGERWEGTAILPRATTEFPDPGPAPEPDRLQRWIGDAVRQRPDMAAAELRVRGAAVLLQAARNELRARLDLEVSAGYTGQARGPAGVLARDFPGADAAVTVSYQLPTEQVGARGRAAQAAAALERQRIARADLERRITIGVLAAFEIARSTQLGLRESADAVKLMQRTVDNEKKKFRLGSTTLFSVNQAEESLTSALLAMIDGHREFAVALATLRFETGTVLAASGNPELTSFPR